MFHRFFDDGLAQSSFFLACPRSREAIRKRSHQGSSFSVRS